MCLGNEVKFHLKSININDDGIVVQFRYNPKAKEKHVIIVLAYVPYIFHLNSGHNQTDPNEKYEIKKQMVL